MPRPALIDDEYQAMARHHIDAFIAYRADLLWGRKVLVIGPTEAQKGWACDTLDILPGCTYQADITKPTPPSANTYDVVLAMEVLEHTVQPFDAVNEIRALLKPGGILLASAPMNFREHGPLPDCWRFTRHGWRVLLKDFDDVALDVLMTPNRPLMPLHIAVSARCNKDKSVDASTMTFPMEAT